MAYSVNEDDPTNKVRIHKAKCNHYNDVRV